MCVRHVNSMKNMNVVQNTIFNFLFHRFFDGHEIFNNVVLRFWVRRVCIFSDLLRQTCLWSILIIVIFEIMYVDWFRLMSIYVFGLCRSVELLLTCLMQNDIDTLRWRLIPNNGYEYDSSLQMDPDRHNLQKILF